MNQRTFGDLRLQFSDMQMFRMSTLDTTASLHVVTLDDHPIQRQFRQSTHKQRSVGTGTDHIRYSNIPEHWRLFANLLR
ncbi:hypothetical protein D3C76_1810040 [compost metagenome]